MTKYTGAKTVFGYNNVFFSDGYCFATNGYICAYCKTDDDRTWAINADNYRENLDFSTEKEKVRIKKMLDRILDISHFVPLLEFTLDLQKSKDFQKFKQLIRAKTKKKQRELVIDSLIKEVYVKDLAEDCIYTIDDNLISSSFFNTKLESIYTVYLQDIVNLVKATKKAINFKIGDFKEHKIVLLTSGEYKVVMYSIK